MLYICISSFYELPDTSFINAVLSEKYPCYWIHTYMYNINCICMLYICILSFYELPDTSFINAVLSEEYPCYWMNINI